MKDLKTISQLSHSSYVNQGERLRDAIHNTINETLKAEKAKETTPVDISTSPRFIAEVSTQAPAVQNVWDNVLTNGIEFADYDSDPS